MPDNDRRKSTEHRRVTRPIEANKFYGWSFYDRNITRFRELNTEIIDVEFDMWFNDTRQKEAK